MQLISGKLPERDQWTVMMTVVPGDTPSFLWKIGEQLAKANKGAIILAFMVALDDAPAAQEVMEAYLTAVGRTADHDHICPLIVSAEPHALQTLIQDASIKLLLIEAGRVNLDTLSDLPCSIAVLRTKSDVDVLTDEPIEQILLPTAGGPYTAHALTFLKNLPRKIDIKALYVSRTDQGLNEEALGRTAINEMLNFADAEERVTSKVVRYASVIEGIVQQSKEADLVVMGASQESNIDKVLFGNVVNSVVRKTNIPVLVVRQSRDRTSTWLDKLDWRIQSIIPRLTQKQREDTYVGIRRNARPDLDYFVLITLSAAIAALGLVANSTAVVIGAMLVAPLMSPIIATGLSLILGDIRFLRYSLGSAVRGILIAIFVGFLIGLIVPGSNLTSEVLARTSPNLLDLGIAIFSGLAGAFALAYQDALGALPGVSIAVALVPPLASVGIAFSDGDWRKGLGALLLFATNFVAITLASAIVFFVFGFRPNPTDINQRRAQARSTQLAVFLLLVIAVLLGGATTRLVLEQNRNTMIENTVRSVVENGAILTDDARLMNDFADVNDPLVSTVANDQLSINLVVRSVSIPSNAQLNAIQARIEAQLDEPIQLTLTHIRTSTPVDTDGNDTLKP